MSRTVEVQQALHSTNSDPETPSGFILESIQERAARSDPPPTIDFLWEPTSREATQKLYRVVRPGQHTFYTKDGIYPSFCKTLQRLPGYTWTTYTHLVKFLHSIRNHRNQSSDPTPYVSFFADKKEAVAWCKAAQDMFGSRGVGIMAVDTVVLKRYKTSWFGVADVFAGLHRIGGWADQEIEKDLGWIMGQSTSEVLVSGVISWDAVVGGSSGWFKTFDARAGELSLEHVGSEHLHITSELGTIHAHPTNGISQQLAMPINRRPADQDMFQHPKFTTTLLPEPCAFGCRHINECDHFDMMGLCERTDEETRYKDYTKRIKEEQAKKAKRERDQRRKTKLEKQCQQNEAIRKNWAAAGPGGTRMDDLR